ncbi:hypothetical protein Bbelb_260730 [Branchiostoma belcheri]|nr:hypothetical protein Bbelb_260730 [Branchiostoma belcheri]
MDELGSVPPVASVPPGTAGVVEPPKLVDSPAPEHPHPEPSFEKPPNKVGRACLVAGYLFAISLAAIVLAIYYSFFWFGDAALFPSTGGGARNRRKPLQIRSTAFRRQP